MDSFGWPRDGHTHQGIDMIAPSGTPVVAAHPGNVTHSSSSSGGIQTYVYGSGGYSFYAHLSGYSSASGSVSARDGDRVRREHRQRRLDQPPSLRVASRAAARQ